MSMPSIANHLRKLPHPMHKVKTLIEHFMSDSLYRNSLYLFTTNASLAATGFLFWAIAARSFSAHDVGLVSTIITAATFIASAGLFGLDHTLIHYLAKHKAKAATIIDTAFSVVTLGAIAFSVGYLLIVPAIAPELAFILSSPLWTVAFVGLMIATTWNNTLGSIFIAFRAAQLILIAGLLFGIGRIVLLAMLSSGGLASLFNAHFISFSTGVIAGLIGLFLAKKYVFKPHLSHEIIRLIRGYSLKTYIASLLASLPPLLTPLLVIAILGPSEAAYYNMPLLMTGLLIIIPMATSQSLFAEGIHEERELKKHCIRSVRLIYTLLVPAIAVVIVGGHFILNIFGTQYADYGYALLIFLSLATLFKAGSFPLIAILRILGDVKEIIITTFVYVACLTTCTYLALLIAGQLWAIGIAVLISEIILLAIYAVIIKKKWPKVINAHSNSTNTEIQ